MITCLNSLGDRSGIASEPLTPAKSAMTLETHTERDAERKKQRQRETEAERETERQLFYCLICPSQGHLLKCQKKKKKAMTLNIENNEGEKPHIFRTSRAQVQVI